jgi:hypothetical protein
LAKNRKTAFELEAMDHRRMLLLDECPFGLKLSVKPDRESWTAIARTDDATCLSNVAQIAAKLRTEYYLSN